MEALMSEYIAVVAGIDPDAYTTGTQLSDVIDMSKHRQVMFVVEAGTLGSSATLDFYVMECATSGGTYTRLSGKSITQLTQAGTDSDKYAIVNVRAEELSSGFRYLKGSLRIGTATSDAGMLALATKGRFADAVTSTSYGDLAAVDEIVA